MPTFRLGQRLNLGVIATWGLRPPAPQDAPCSKYNGAHRGIRVDTTRTSGRPGQSPLHLGFVVTGSAHSGSSSLPSESAGSSAEPDSESAASR